MNYQDRLKQEPKHALLGASRWQWLNDDEESLLNRVKSFYAAQVGTVIHAYAADRITYGFKLAKTDKKNLIFELLKAGIPNMVVDTLDFNFIFENLMNYVNDAIGFHMDPEVEVRYCEYCFGTADTIKYYDKDRMLRIHDLKTGTIPAHMEQLMIYAALYCLQHRIKPLDIDYECRIYQACDILYLNPSGEEIQDVANNIVSKCAFLDKINGGRK